MHRYSLLVVVLILGVIGFVAIRECANTVLIGERHAATLPLSQVSHQPWDELLRTHVDETGLVDYAAWKASQEDQARLMEYLQGFSRVDLLDAGASEADVLAFWINAYNALTVYAVLDVHPTSTIYNHVNPIGFSVWHHVKLMIGGTAYSLTSIEDILRKRNEPRIHFAIVCATLSSPPLLNQAYSRDKLDLQLDERTAVFFEDKNNFRIEGENRVHLSSTFKWYKRDFGATDQERRRLIASYLSDPDEQRVIKSPQTEITYRPYDRHINAQD